MTVAGRSSTVLGSRLLLGTETFPGLVRRRRGSLRPRRSKGVRGVSLLSFFLSLEFYYNYTFAQSYCNCSEPAPCVGAKGSHPTCPSGEQGLPIGLVSGPGHGGDQVLLYCLGGLAG